MAERTVTPTPERWEKWTPFFKFWKLNFVTDEGFGQGPESIAARRPLEDALVKILDPNEYHKLDMVLRTYPEVTLHLKHEGKFALMLWFILIAVKWGIPKEDIIHEVYEGNEMPELDQLIKREEKYLVWEAAKQKERNMEERGESSKKGAGA
ncbi:Nn.00g066960.m01.CDS01 [Neocucurbitaria sp. VM-36]